MIGGMEVNRVSKVLRGREKAGNDTLQAVGMGPLMLRPTSHFLSKIDRHRKDRLGY